MMCYFRLIFITSLLKLFFLLLLDPCEEKACDFFGKCLAKPDKTTDCVCPVCKLEYNIVCGNDGNNYASLCWMKQYACQQKKSVTLLQKQPCGMCTSLFVSDGFL